MQNSFRPVSYTHLAAGAIAAILTLGTMGCANYTAPAESSGGLENSQNGAVQTEAVNPDAVPIKIANFFADNHPINLALQSVFKPMLEEKTQGRYTVEIYSNSVLGGEKEITEAAKMGTVEAVSYTHLDVYKRQDMQMTSRLNS